MGTPTGRTPAAVGERFPATRQVDSCAKVKDPIGEPRAKIQRQQLLQENAALRTTINNLTREIAEIRKLLLCNNEPLQRPTPSTSKTEETTTNTQETAVEEPAPKKRAVEATSDSNETNNGDLPSREHEQIRLHRKNLTADREPPDVCAPLRATSTQPGNLIHANAIIATNAATAAAGVTAWQWNCRGLGRKKIVIQQHIAHAARKPDSAQGPARRQMPVHPGQEGTHDEHARYVDAAELPRNAVAAVVIEASTGATRSAASVRSARAEQVEEVANAMAIADADCLTVLSDSRQAVRNFAKCQICREAERVLREAKLQDRKVRIKWFPAHAVDTNVIGRHEND
ncbi:hypothetical protein HPB49_017387 [Dermacentor silvarum]|uniref:Uncharacterized protein n=1 Tax=Dermacentor silvarum TaxID=543639 RepID=A0ACB8E1U5_DERSI|nr:hypothetical protein HPB49_017387 [Dermacentor silvarum]